MSSTKFGELALRDRHFVRQLRAGRRVWPDTADRVRSFIKQYDGSTPASAGNGGKNSDQAERVAA